MKYINLEIINPATPPPNDAAAREYAEFALEIYESGVLFDPYFDGTPRFNLDGVVLSKPEAQKLNHAAETVTLLHEQLVEILIDDAQLMGEFYALTATQRAMWAASGGMWHAVARADLFITKDNQVKCCELNSDTPSGQAEAVVLNDLLYARNAKRNRRLSNPNAAFAARYIQLLMDAHAKRTDKPLTSVGIIYPTELTEDLGTMTLIARLLESRGISVVQGSPYNIRRRHRRLEVINTPVDLIVRHYKTDWFGERETVWRDATDYADSEPLVEPLRALLEAEINDEVTIVNPFGSVVTQNKKSLAFMFQHKELFRPESQTAITELLPETRLMTNIRPEQLLDEQAAWVLKSDYGCESAETVCGAFVTANVWRRAVESAKPEHFVAQRFFEVAPRACNRLANFGVYVLGGAASGFFTRLSHQSTQYDSLTVPTFIEE